MAAPTACLLRKTDHRNGNLIDIFNFQFSILSFQEAARILEVLLDDPDAAS